MRSGAGAPPSAARTSAPPFCRGAPLPRGWRRFSMVAAVPFSHDDGTRVRSDCFSSLPVLLGPASQPLPFAAYLHIRCRCTCTTRRVVPILTLGSTRESTYNIAIRRSSIGFGHKARARFRVSCGSIIQDALLKPQRPARPVPTRHTVRASPRVLGSSSCVWAARLGKCSLRRCPACALIHAAECA